MRVNINKLKNIMGLNKNNNLIPYIKEIMCISIVMCIELPFIILFFDCQHMKYNNSYIHEILFYFQYIAITFLICYIVLKKG